MPGLFDLRLQRAKEDINEALGQRMPNLGPPPNQQQTQLPGNPQITPQGLAFSGQQQMGPGMLSGGATVGPQGFGGAGVNYSAPVAGGQFNVGAGVDPRMQLSQMQAEYQRGPFSAGVQYQPGAGVSGGVQYRQAFQEGGLASSVRNDPLYHDRDIEFVNTRNQHMRELAGKHAYAKGGGVWTRKEGKNPEGGLNAKGRASLRAQGQDIKPPVSAKQAAKSPKSAARRKSFCARMGGMEGPMKDDNGKPTRKALALRKWDCKAEGGLIEVEGRRIMPSPDLLSLDALSDFRLPEQGSGGGGGSRMEPLPDLVSDPSQMPFASTAGYVGPTLRGDGFQVSVGPGRRGSVGVGGRLQFAEGGSVKPIWDKKRPKDLDKPKSLSAKKKKSAKARAAAAGRPYPNLVDNMAAARKKGK
jgi:hypothetical protein